MNNLKYYEILAKNKELFDAVQLFPSFEISVLSNITVNQFKEILEFSLRSEKMNPNIFIGNYDNILQDAQLVSNSKLVIVFWELINYFDGFQYKFFSLTPEQIVELKQKFIGEIDLLFKNLENVPQVIFNSFSCSAFNNDLQTNVGLNDFCESLNSYVRQNHQKNFKLVDANQIFNTIGLDKCINWKNYYVNKIFYTVDFFKQYVQFISPIIRNISGKTKKVLVLDCDNTLWKGIIGEDGFKSIQMSAHDKEGLIYHEIQQLALTLQKRGVLLALCSKNNPADVDEVLQNHKDMVLKDEYFTIKKVNWNDKVSNLKSIAKELNLGTDSLVFVDDSDFEINLIKEQMPEVETLQVPKNIFDYPSQLRDLMNMFYSGNITQEDLKRAEMYKQQLSRNVEKQQFNSLDEYIGQLDIIVDVFLNDVDTIARVSQMTQKTNQFNLTTKRYTETEIESFMNNPTSDVFAFNVRDKFGDNGITALCILNYSGNIADIDSFLMSCRIIGRNVEFKIMECLFEHCKKNGIKIVNTQFIKTAKNDQVYDFYDKAGFEVVNKTDEITNYKIDLSQLEMSTINYIQLNYGRTS